MARSSGAKYPPPPRAQSTCRMIHGVNSKINTWGYIPLERAFHVGAAIIKVVGYLQQQLVGVACSVVKCCSILGLSAAANGANNRANRTDQAKMSLQILTLKLQKLCVSVYLMNMQSHLHELRYVPTVFVNTLF